MSYGIITTIPHSPLRRLVFSFLCLYMQLLQLGQFFVIETYTNNTTKMIGCFEKEHYIDWVKLHLRKDAF